MHLVVGKCRALQNNSKRGKLVTDKFCTSATLRAALGENRLFAYAKPKTQISFAVTPKLISGFVFATRIVQSLYFLHSTFQASSHLLWLYIPFCVGPGWKPRRPVFSERGSYCPGSGCYWNVLPRFISRTCSKGFMAGTGMFQKIFCGQIIHYFIHFMRQKFHT